MTTTKKPGRPTVYNPEEHPKVAREQTGNGRTLADLAKLLGVARSTIEEWQNVHPEFSVAIKLGREDAIDRVERSLFERAVGYSHPEVKLLVVSQGKGMPSIVERHKVTAHYPPDTAAAMAFLKNKRPAEWKDKHEVEGSLTLTLEQILAESNKVPEAPKP